MVRKWDKLGGDQGKDVPSGRLDRLMRVGRLGLSMSASTVAQKVGQSLRSEAGREARDGAFRSRQAEKVLKVLGELKGASMKVGQILSNDPDLVPPEFIEKLTALQHKAPPMTYRMVRQQVESAFDRPITDVFQSFQPDPIGSASIGQVHRATLSTGEDVAVKVQYPGIAATLDSDLDNLATLMNLGRVFVDRQRLDDYLAEVRHAVLQELDYEAEARNLRTFHHHFERRPGVRVPQPFEAWTRPSVLTMEYIEGQKFDEAVLGMHDWNRASGLLQRFVDTYAWMFHDLYQLHADPHPGNFILMADDTLVFLDFGCIKECDRRFADGVLDIMDACWQQDSLRASRLYQELGFGRPDADPAIYDPTLLRAHHEIFLAPFLEDEVFDFGSWDLRAQMQRFVRKHPAFLKMTPPAEGLLLARVMAGIKGLLNKTNARLNVHRMAVATARRRGRLTGEPRKAAGDAR